jgi:hypothetical protein
MKITNPRRTKQTFTAYFYGDVTLSQVQQGIKNENGTTLPTLESQQERLVWLTGELALHATLLERLKSGISLEQLKEDGLVVGDEARIIELLNITPVDYLKPIPNETCTATLYALISAGMIAPLQEEQSKKDSKEFWKTMNSNKGIKPPGLEHPCQKRLHALGVDEYFEMDIPQTKRWKSANTTSAISAHSSKIKAGQAAIPGEFQPDVMDPDRKISGTLTDLNRLALLPHKHSYVATFLQCLNHYGKLVETDVQREDIFIAPPNITPSGFADQKVLVALTKGVVPGALGVKGTVAELMITSPEQFAAKKKTDPIYKKILSRIVGPNNAPIYTDLNDDALAGISDYYREMEKEWNKNHGINKEVYSPLRLHRSVLDYIHSDPTPTPNKWCEVINVLKERAQKNGWDKIASCLESSVEIIERTGQLPPIETLEKATGDSVKFLAINRIMERAIEYHLRYHSEAAQKSDPSWAQEWVRLGIEHNSKILHWDIEGAMPAHISEYALREVVGEKTFEEMVLGKKRPTYKDTWKDARKDPVTSSDRYFTR